jgi:hypothetical protein
MGKAKKVDAVQQETQPTRYVIGARGAKYNGHEGTKKGTDGKGTSGTWTKVRDAVAANEGSIDFAALKAVCAADNDPGFARYALRNNWLVPKSND